MYIHVLYTNRVCRTTKCVPFIEVSSFQGVLIREVPLYSPVSLCLFSITIPHLFVILPVVLWLSL